MHFASNNLEQNEAKRKEEWESAQFGELLDCLKRGEVDRVRGHYYALLSDNQASDLNFNFGFQFMYDLDNQDYLHIAKEYLSVAAEEGSGSSNDAYLCFAIIADIEGNSEECDMCKSIFSAMTGKNADEKFNKLIKILREANSEANEPEAEEKAALPSEEASAASFTEAHLISGISTQAAVVRTHQQEQTQCGLAKGNEYLKRGEFVQAREYFAEVAKLNSTESTEAMFIRDFPLENFKAGKSA